jgi:acyl-CoA hydrolase
MSELMQPADANAAGDVHGGTIMKMVDNAAGVCAMRHSRTRVVTASMDSMSFLHPVYVGNLVTVKAYLVMVALDEHGEPTGAPPILCETEAEKRRQAQAKIRRESRKLRQEAIKRTMDPGAAAEV